MKKPVSNQRPPSRGNGQRRNNSNTSRNGQGQNGTSQDRNNSNNGQNRNSGGGSGKRSHTPHLWASTSSTTTTLTSHLSMVNRRNQDGTSRNTNSKNGTGRPGNKPRGKFSRQNENNRNGTQQGRPNQRPHSNKPQTAHQNRSHNKPQNAPAKPSQQATPDAGRKLESKTNTFGLDPFELFCAYHLGIAPNNQYRPSNINEVARRFNQETGTIRQILKEYGMDSASLLDRDFDMALAQLDIQVAPEGINRTELGRSIFEDFLEAPIVKRDWKKILDEDRKENAKVFGR